MASGVEGESILRERTRSITPEEVALQSTRQTPKITLHHAARDNREEIVQQWISLLTGKDVSKLNKKDSFGYTPLHYAAKFNRYNVLVMLVEAGADPTVTTTDEKLTPLHFAARYIPRIVSEEVQKQESQARATGITVEVSKLSTSVQAVQYLVQRRDVKVNVRARYGISALHFACQRGNKFAVDILLRRDGIIVDIKDDNKDTPLHEACLGGHLGIVESILTYKKLSAPNADQIDLNLTNNELQTPLHLACREGHEEVVKTLLKQFSSLQLRTELTKCRDNEQNTPLHLACESGKEEIVKILMLNGADLFSVKLEDIAPVHIAARYGFTKVVNTLMQSGEDLMSTVEIYNQTPLHYAASHNQMEMISFLIDKGADVTATDIVSNTPILLAARAGHVEAFKVLLNRGSQIDDLNDRGKSVLHLAAENNHVEVLKCVLKNESGLKLINSTDSIYNTPLHLAAARGNVEAVGILLRESSKSIKADAKNELNKTPTHLAAAKGHINVVETLVNFQNDCILDEDEDGNTPLHLASINGFPKVVELLLNFQADFDARNANMWTPIDCAANKGHENVVQVLVNAGADINPTDKQQTTPLHLAAQEGHLNVVTLLLESNADAGKCANTRNALDMAIDNGHEDIALAIIKSSQWKKALRNTTTSPLGKCTTPLRKLIRKMPEVAEEVFNRCSEANDTTDGRIRPDSKEYTVTFSYEFLEDFRDKKEDFCTRIFNTLTKGSSYQVSVTDSEDTSDELSGVDKNENTDVQEDILEGTKPKSRGFATKWGPIGFEKALHPLSIMVENGRTDLLKHPLVTSLLRLKWNAYGRKAYFSNLLFFILFVLFLTTFALISLNPQSQTCQAVFSDTFGNASSDTVMYEVNDNSCDMVDSSNNISNLFTGITVCNNVTLMEMCGVDDIYCGECGLSSLRSTFLSIATTVVLIVAIIRLLFEVFQFFILKLRYVIDWVNWLEVILFISSLIFVSVYWNDCQCTAKWQWQIGIVAVFLAWIDFIIFIRKLPLTGIFVLMFVHIFSTFCKVIILTLLLIFAFSFAFYMAFFDPSDEFMRASFATPGRAIVKTMTMTTGEFEYDSIFRQFPGGSTDEDITREIPFPPISFILWIIFLVLMPILLTNLLVGLAVDDIKGIQDAAALKRLALQVELALSVEELLPKRLRRWFIREECTITPNRTLSLIEKLRYEVFGDGSRFDDPDNVSNALHPQLTPLEQIQNETHQLVLDLKNMKDTINELSQRNIAIEKLLQDVSKKFSDGTEASRTYI